MSEQELQALLARVAALEAKNAELEASSVSWKIRLTRSTSLFPQLRKASPLKIP